MMYPLHESSHLLGKQHRLVGISTRPSTGLDPALPAVVFLNSGIIHRIGPNRLYVRLARALAVDAEILAELSLPPLEAANGQFVLDPDPVKRGPYADVDASHQWLHSEFTLSSDMCATCHDALEPLADGGAIDLQPAGPLPGNGPAAALNTQVIGTLASQVDLGALLQWEHATLVLQQHERLAHGFSRDLPVLG